MYARRIPAGLRLTRGHARTRNRIASSFCPWLTGCSVSFRVSFYPGGLRFSQETGSTALTGEVRGISRRSITASLMEVSACCGAHAYSSGDQQASRAAPFAFIVKIYTKSISSQFPGIRRSLRDSSTSQSYVFSCLIIHEYSIRSLTTLDYVIESDMN